MRAKNFLCVGERHASQVHRPNLGHLNAAIAVYNKAFAQGCQAIDLQHQFVTRPQDVAGRHRGGLYRTKAGGVGKQLIAIQSKRLAGGVEDEALEFGFVGSGFATLLGR